MALVHPQMLAQLEQAGFFPSSATFYAQASGVDSYGRRNGSWAAVTALSDLACSVNRPSRSRGAPQEVRRDDVTITTATHEIVLAGAYPAVTTKMRAVVDGVTYDVLSVVCDAQGASTVVMAELVTT